MESYINNLFKSDIHQLYCKHVNEYVTKINKRVTDRGGKRITETELEEILNSDESIKNVNKHNATKYTNDVFNKIVDESLKVKMSKRLIHKLKDNIEHL